MNKPIDIEKFRVDIDPYVKVYRGLYRVWMHLDANVPLEELEREARSRKHLSATTDLHALAQMIDFFGGPDEDPAVTKFDAEGFDPYEILRVGLEQNPDVKDAAFMRGALQHYGFQKEIIVLKILGPQFKVNE